MRLAHKYLYISSLILFATLVCAGQAADYKGVPLDKTGLKKAAADPRGRPAALIGLIRSNGVDFQITAEIDSELRYAKVAPAVIAAAKDNLRLGNGRRASFLTVTSNLPDAQFDIDGRMSFSVSVTEQPLEPGTYKVTARRGGYSPQTKTVLLSGPATRDKIYFELKQMSVNQLWLEAEGSFKLRDYATVVSNCREILQREPTNAKASMLLARSYYLTDRFDQSLDPLLNAIKWGGSAIFDGQRSDSSFWGGRSLRPARLILKADLISFESGDKDDFEVPYAKILQIKTGVREEVSIKVRIPKSGKKGEEDKDFSFYPVKNQVASANLSVFSCNCRNDSLFILDVIGSIRRNAK